MLQILRRWHPVGYQACTLSVAELKHRVSRPSGRCSLSVSLGHNGLFGNAALTRPEDFIYSALKSRELCGQVIQRLISGRTKDGAEIIADLDFISNTLCLTVDAAELCRNVHFRQDWRQAAEEAFEQISEFIHELNTNVSLYEVVRNTIEDPQLVSRLSEDEIRVGQLLKGEYESSGIHLPEPDRQETLALLCELTGLETLFSSNIHTKRHAFQVSKADILQHVPAKILQSCIPAQPAGQDPKFYTLTADNRVSSTLLRSATCAKVRRRLYEETYTQPWENTDVLRVLIQTRDRLARKLGFKSYAHRCMSDKIVGSPERVEGFLWALSERVKGKADAELQVLKQYKQREEGSDVIQMWDLPYYASLVKSERHPLDHGAISAYLSIHNALHGLAILCQKLFGISMQRVPLQPNEGWTENDEDIQKMIFAHPQEGHLGTMYLDLYARPSKYSHHAQFVVCCGCQPRGSTEYQLPTIALVCNFTAAKGTSADSWASKLLSHAELEALFHEFGHALHSILSKTRFQHVAGTRAALDFVETPSSLLEHFVWDHRFLQQFAHHPRTGQPIPKDAIRALRASRAEFVGIDTQTQILYSLVDQRLFGPQSLDHDPVSSDFLAQMQKEVIPGIPHAQGTTWHTRFGHFVGYGAGYYGYLYNQVFAAQIWDKLFAADPLSSASGEALRKRLLVYGGSKDPNAILRELLGEEPRMDSYLSQLGLSET